jgi:hypothetical protein
VVPASRSFPGPKYRTARSATVISYRLLS